MTGHEGPLKSGESPRVSYGEEVGSGTPKGEGGSPVDTGSPCDPDDQYCIHLDGRSTDSDRHTVEGHVL